MRTQLLALTLLSIIFICPAEAKEWRGSQIYSAEQFRYGAFEARMQGGKGSGIVTPFFLYKFPAGKTASEWQELDFELFGSDGRFQSQIITPGNPRTQHFVYHEVEGLSYASFHTYRMEWTPAAISFYLDGQLIRRETDQIEFSKVLDPKRAEPMHIFFTLWAGDSSWSGHLNPKEMPAWALVQYVKAEYYTPGSGPDGSDFTPAWTDTFQTFDSRRWIKCTGTTAEAVNDYDPSYVFVKDSRLVLYFGR